MSAKIRLAVLGNMIYDCVVWADRLPKKGETVKGYKSGFFCGGKGANQAVQAARLGAEVYMISKVGQDKEGEILLDNLKRNGVNTDYVTVDSRYRTDICCIYVDRNGDNAIITNIQSGDNLTKDDVEKAYSVIKKSDMFITQLEMDIDTIEYAVNMAKQLNTGTILNPAPARDIPCALYHAVDYITPNETEAELLTGIKMENEELGHWTRKVYENFRDKGVPNVVITLSSKGAFYGTPKACDIVPPYYVQAVDATGAGDAFNAALAVKLSEGCDLENAVQYANAAGALSASKEGAQTSFATESQIQYFLTSRLLCEKGANG